MFAISFVNIENGVTQGYSVKLELEPTDEETELLLVKEKNMQDPVYKKFVKNSDFQFSFNPIYKKFVRELKDEESKL